jgi:UDP-3-O-[3-hydroxymyristoyl] N-acetylglucosamine deacetylase
MPINSKVLVVDDEAAIRQAVCEVLEDEGFSTLSAVDGHDALSKIGDYSPNIVLLDIWMPGMDGIETLKMIRSTRPEIPVIMISGHATITTAVKATQLGAFDFIEKPLDLCTIVSSVKRALEQAETPPWSHIVKEQDSDQDLKPQLVELVFKDQRLRGKARQQKTMAKSSLIYGSGLHSGQKSGLSLEPLPANSGIHFAGVTSEHAVPAHLNYIDATGFATTIKLKDAQVGTVEHLMSALHAYGITNLLIKCNGEVPALDGSSIEFCKLIEAVGVVEQDAPCYEIAVDRVYEVKGKGSEFIRIEPHDKFLIDYTLIYPEPVGKQNFVFELNDLNTYKEQIAPARTFGFVKDIEYLQKMGLAQGGRFNNFILIGENGAINGKLRFPDELVRHKILDAIGDLYLLGRPLCGKITACMTGHSDNANLLKQIFAQMQVSA